MPERQDPIGVLWERLQAATPASVAEHAAVAWDAEAEAFVLPLVGDDVRIVPAERRMEGAGGFEATIACVQYLLTSQRDAKAGELVSPVQLPYGDFFFRGPHELPAGPIEQAFGTQLDSFRAAAEKLGGRPVDMGDAAFEFNALPRVPITVVLWVADEEFPARVQFLYDKLADRHLPLDALWVLTKHLAKKLAAAADG